MARSLRPFPHASAFLARGHFGTQGQLQFGEACADAYLRAAGRAEPDLRWAIAAPHAKAPWGNAASVEQGLEELALSVNDVVVVDPSDLPQLRAHFGTEWTLRLGVALAEALSAEPPQPTAADGTSRSR